MIFSQIPGFLLGSCARPARRKVQIGCMEGLIAPTDPYPQMNEVLAAPALSGIARRGGLLRAECRI